MSSLNSGYDGYFMFNRSASKKNADRLGPISSHSY
jgi:hypothetical protein